MRCTELKLKIRLAGLHLQLKRVAHEQKHKVGCELTSVAANLFLIVFNCKTYLNGVKKMV